MNEKPKRAWFQIHLSTAVVLMLVAGVLLGINLYVAVLNPSMFDAGLPLADYPRDRLYDGQLALHTPFTLSISLAINVSIVILVGSLAERFIRRREGRKP